MSYIQLIFINYFSFKNKNRQIYSILCLLLFFSICSYGQKAEFTQNSPEVKDAEIITPSRRATKIELEEDLILKEVISTFNQNNQQILNELKSQDIVKYTALMNSVQDIYELEKDILVLSKESSLSVEKNTQLEKVALLKKKLADIKNQYSLN